MSVLATACVLSLVLILVGLLPQRRRRLGLPLPPSPPGLPFLGNVHNHPKSQAWKAYHAWAKEYDSDIIHLNMAGNSIIVLDSYEACVELLDRRSGLYSSRPHSVMFKLLGWLDWDFAFMPYGSRWRAHRRMFHQTIHEGTTKNFRPHQAEMVQRLLTNIARTPSDFAKHIQLMASQLMLVSIYGLDVDSVEHPYVQLAEKTLEILHETTVGGKYLVEAFPVLQYIPEWFPGAGFRRDAREWRTISEEYLNYTMSEAESQIDDGTAPYSFVSNQLTHSKGAKGTAEYLEQHDLIRNVAGLMYSAGSETTFGTLMTFMHLISTHPDVRRKAQAELDSALLRGEMPSFDQLDAGVLPYLTAVVKETIRWNAVVPLLVPHCIETEDEYKGYRIPANSTVLGNAWAILHDEKMYPEPEAFRPERFLKEDGTLNPDIRDPYTVAFGFGRRICPGRHFALSAVWISAASLLRAFDISCEVDVSGQTIVPVVEYQHSLTTFPKPFKCRIQPRVY